MTGMPLRDDRIHRYVNAFCPQCHEERPGPAAGRGAPAVRAGWRCATTGSGWSGAARTTAW